ncbi:hypothetical protein J4219_02225 [Candidatus Woesearchaeota archaeon]|nr:hypothetical protein [Candidatus Woesearchaeota archaeon]
MALLKKIVDIKKAVERLNRNSSDAEFDEIIKKIDEILPQTDVIKDSTPRAPKNLPLLAELSYFLIHAKQSLKQRTSRYVPAEISKATAAEAAGRNLATVEQYATQGQLEVDTFIENLTIIKKLLGK